MTKDKAKALKVGDMVVCVSDTHAVGFIVGNKYEIMGISKYGNPYVHLPDGGPWYLIPDCEYRDDFKVVREEAAPTFSWKVGQTYQLRNGEIRKLIYITKFFLVLEAPNGDVSSRYLDGTLFSHSPKTDYDLMPPEQYLVVLNAREHIIFDSEEEAKTAYPDKRIIKI